MKLTVENVMNMASAAQAQAEKTGGGTEVHAVMLRDYLDVTGMENEIIAMLDQLPEPFHAETGGGWTFLNACNDRTGEQWTGSHAVMDTLVALGIAVGRVAFVLPREMWPAFPGGMPYFVVKGQAHD